jgi:hypothetical protein
MFPYFYQSSRLMQFAKTVFLGKWLERVGSAVTSFEPAEPEGRPFGAVGRQRDEPHGT